MRVPAVVRVVGRSPVMEPEAEMHVAGTDPAVYVVGNVPTVMGAVVTPRGVERAVHAALVAALGTVSVQAESPGHVPLVPHPILIVQLDAASHVPLGQAIEIT